jgi:AcrR family transcriptional regulator
VGSTTGSPCGPCAVSVRDGKGEVIGRTRGPGPDHQARRDEIADAVLDVVASGGLPAVTMQAVASCAGVSVGRIQHYYATKAALLEAAFDRSNERSSDRIEMLLGAPPDQAPPLDVLTVVLTELVPHDDWSWTHLRVRQSFVSRGLHDPQIAERLRGEYATLHRRLGACVAQLQGRSMPNHVDAIDHAAGLVALAEGVANHVLIGAMQPNIARVHILDAIARTSDR